MDNYKHFEDEEEHTDDEETVYEEFGYNSMQDYMESYLGLDDD